MESVQEVVEKLSPLERKIVPFLNLPIEKIKEKTGLDDTSLLRALKFLEAKGLLKISIEKARIIELGTNGIYYKKNHLPERNLLTLIENKKAIHLEEAEKASKLTDNEFKVSLGVLKSKAMIELKNGKIMLTASKEEITKKSQLALQNLKKRKDIIEIQERSVVTFTLTELGKKIAGKEISSDSIEEVTSEIIKTWKRGKKFRRYDVNSEVPVLYGGKKHFVNKTIEKGRRIWLDMGFKEMRSTYTQTSFWNFDALFTAQDHPVRELHDTFFIKDLKGQLPENKLVSKVKQSHEKGSSGSKGWQYVWDENEAKKIVLRTHTTCLSAKTLASLDIKKDLPAKFFAIGKCFRNETIDWSHGFEFNQTEGIVVDKNANFRNLLGYLQEFAKKMGFTKIRIQPAYFPYTEPSVEGAVWHEGRKEWVEVLAAGIFRPEVTEPLLGEPIPVLAWGPGFDRLMLLAHNMNDIRKIYENDLKDLRNKKVLI
ncbi:phenylalanine--tRNA ligase subunit alpha [Candidatus Pacearchaeota archaeon]|nr:phenylalanine--tRNA ligase subunit alpha [Candidatus Pacearchaeota archaeon]